VPANGAFKARHFRVQHDPPGHRRVTGRRSARTGPPPAARARPTTADPTLLPDGVRAVGPARRTWPGTFPAASRNRPRPPGHGRAGGRSLPAPSRNRPRQVGDGYRVHTTCWPTAATVHAVRRRAGAADDTCWPTPRTTPAGRHRGRHLLGRRRGRHLLGRRRGQLLLARDRRAAGRGHVDGRYTGARPARRPVGSAAASACAPHAA
jgi:hypothetical protein